MGVKLHYLSAVTRTDLLGAVIRKVAVHSLYLSMRQREKRYAFLLSRPCTTLPPASVSRWSAYHGIMVMRCSRYWALL